MSDFDLRLAGSTIHTNLETTRGDSQIENKKYVPAKQSAQTQQRRRDFSLTRNEHPVCREVRYSWQA